MKKNLRKLLLVSVVCPAALSILSACGAVGNNSSPLEKYESSDMLGYTCLTDYDKELRFKNMDVSDVEKEMKKGSSFALYTGYSNCPWCNVMLTYLNDAALESDAFIGYIDTRKDPTWKNNTEIEGYDTFVELFSDCLSLDDEGQKHLYVPHVFFIKDGEVVYDHSGTASGQTSHEDALTKEQQDELKNIYLQGFEKLK